MAWRSERSRASWRRRESSAPLPNGLVMDAWKARVGNSRDRVCSQRLVTQEGTRSHLLSSSSRCLWRRCLRMCCSRKKQRVPIGSRASSTWMMTSEESRTLYSSPQMRLDWPFSIARSRMPSRKVSSPTAGSSNESRRWSAPLTSSSKLSTASLGRLRWALEPKVSSKGCTVRRLARTCLPLRFFSGSSRSCRGSFFSLSSTV
mmetsp:Transcript_22596/g.57454  ORF Transcript_22596/g.57454 Transcript_22596/m.57454 type:complete len:203 (-) Transcript_22596:345-953(-)